MTLSILIPTHDFTCYKLVYDLHEQAERLGIDYEIIVAEDGSRYTVSMIANLKVENLSNCKYFRQQPALKPAGIRNLLAEKAQGEWIMFIDSDAKVDSDVFLKKYLDNKDKADVVVGGVKTPDAHLNPEVSLRYRYEKEADKHRSAEERMKNPYARFATFNFMVKRSVFMDIKFDKDCKEYGYEDALFGVELKKRNVSILHIDNALIHTGLDDNKTFLKKTETALHTLKGLNGKMKSYSGVEQMYAKLQSLHMLWAMRLFFWLLSSQIKKNLLGKKPSLFWFSVYKLGYYGKIKN